MSIQSKNPIAQPRGRFGVTVESNRMICREHYRLRLRVGSGQAFPPTRPGHFVQLGCRPPEADTAIFGNELEWEPGCRVAVKQPELLGRVAVLRKPFSLSGRGDDEKGTWLEVIHRVVGVGTAWLAERKAGDAMDLIGPLGNVFELPGGSPGESLALLVGGGVGLPPMFYLAEALRAAGGRAIGFVGALSRDLLAVSFDLGIAPDDTGRPNRCVVEFARHGFDSVVTTDDGTLGLRGRITAGLEKVIATLSPAEAARAVVYTCGPEPMMHAVADMAASRGVACQVCLEQAMACGMGTCQSCVVKIEDRDRPQATTEGGRPWRFKLACTDGPVFEAAKVVW